MKKDANWKVEKLKPTRAGYKIALKDGRIQILDKKLGLYKPILAKQYILVLVIVPTALRWKIFRHFHA